MEYRKKKEVVLVMPAYNEEECIEVAVKQWINFFDAKFGKNHYTILVINDGSKDRTGEILNDMEQQFGSLEVVHQENQGHGAAVLNGYKRAIDKDPEWVFQTDSDNQFKTEDFDILWGKRKSSKFITGYRKHRKDDFNRLIITRILRGIVLVFFQCRIKDSNVPYRLMEAKYLRTLLYRLPFQAFAPNIFIAVLAKNDGQKLYEFPIDHQARETGKVSIVKWSLLKVCFRSLRELFAFRFSKAYHAGKNLETPDSYAF
jgi:glycosyltransferase involved in cell wall biosynthesis